MTTPLEHVTATRRLGDTVTVRCVCGWTFASKDAEDALWAAYDHEEYT